MKQKAQVGYRVTTPDAGTASARNLTSLDRKILVAILVLATAVRTFGLSWPASIVFDEIHFGGFARKYIIGRFYFDVHPPLAKMLFAAVGYLGGYRGDFEFKQIGDDYIRPGVPYITMRMLPTVCGILTIGLCYSTLRASGVRTLIAATGALLLTFENMHATESRYILLDSPLLLFIALAVYGFKKFENQQPFTKNWYKFLFLAGIGLGTTVSSKWVGLFTIAWVGVLTLNQLWWLLGDRSVSLRQLAHHFFSRAVCLIAVPLTIYLAMFWAHFYCVDNMGDGASFMPREFQTTLKHNSLPTGINANVAFGSKVSIRHYGSNSGWLHSHAHNYETGSRQQQITIYGHKDDNNLFQITNATADWNPNNESHPVYLRDGALVRLRHLATKKNLHSHDHRPPIGSQDHFFEVSGYGYDNFDGDSNDNWKVRIVRKLSVGDGKDRVKALRTVFQLVHEQLNCELMSRKIKLPTYAFEQQQVMCIRPGQGTNTYWYVEENLIEDDPNPELVSYQTPSFLSSFWELQKSMWNVNKGLVETHVWESRPFSWLFTTRGINMWGHWHRQVFLIGNRPLYFTIAILLAIYVVSKVVQILIWQRWSHHTGSLPIFGREAATRAAWANFDTQFGEYALGWFLHWAPSFLMVRQLFLHHYLASSYFGLLAVAQVFELLCEVMRPRVLARIITALFLVVCIVFYAWYSPLIYGREWTKGACLKSRFARNDFDCNNFKDSLAEYKEVNINLTKSLSSAYAGLPLETGEVSETASEPVPSEVPEQPKSEEPVPVPVPEEPVPVPEEPVPVPEEPVHVPEEPVPESEQPVPEPEQPVPEPEQPVLEPEQPEVQEAEKLKVQPQENVQASVQAPKQEPKVEAKQPVVVNDQQAEEILSAHDAQAKAAPVKEPEAAVAPDARVPANEEPELEANVREPVLPPKVESVA